MRLRLLPELLLLLAPPCIGQAPTPNVKGYITRVASPSDFDVNGKHVVVDNNTEITLDGPASPHIPKQSQPSLKSLRPYLGEPAQVFASYDAASKTYAALDLTLHSRVPWVITGSGIIDAIPPLPADASPTDRIVRADGYRILLSSKTHLLFKKPLKSLSDVGTNVWITYRGTRGLDSIVVADLVQFSPNVISPDDLRLRGAWEYDPTTAVPVQDRQSSLDKAVRGVDPTRFPPYKDDKMQARIAAVGTRLIPRYQLNLPAADATRINFRFYLVDAPRWHAAVPLPNGIVLVPYTLVQQFSSDDQLAAILADSIGWLLEQQPPPLPRDARDLAIDAAMLASPLATAASILDDKNERSFLQKQRDRVSLSLLSTAGYDIAQAPVAWWRIHAKDPTDLASAPLPAHAAYLYQVLGDAWPLTPDPPGR